ncbi:MAG: hypothetical protein RIT31_1022, partial [Actinomycetota bacterium]
QVVGDPSLDNKNRRVIRDIRFSLSGLINQVRDEIFDLRHENSKSFAQIITEQAETILFNSSINVEITGEVILDSSHKFEVIRAMRELLINAKRHSKCDLIQIDLSDEKIIVKDNGIGGLETKDNSYGIVGVKERLQLIGAEVLLSSEFSGTKIEILLKK